MSANGRNETKTLSREKKGFMAPPVKLLIELIIFAMFLAAIVFLLLQVAPGIKTTLMKQVGIKAAEKVLTG